MKSTEDISEDLSRGGLKTPLTALPAPLITNQTDFISVRHLQKFLLRINKGLTL